jgi:hypothetical protein
LPVRCLRSRATTRRKPAFDREQLRDSTQLVERNRAHSAIVIAPITRDHHQWTQSPGEHHVQSRESAIRVGPTWRGTPIAEDSQRPCESEEPRESPAPAALPRAREYARLRLLDNGGSWESGATISHAFITANGSASGCVDLAYWPY